MPLHPVFRAQNLALISGGGSGIGLALARLCHSHGMRVLIADVNRAHLDVARRELPQATCEELDVSSEAAWRALAKKAAAEGGVDLLVLNAGIQATGRWGDGAYWRTMFDVNVFGVVHGINAFFPSLSTGDKPRAVVVTGSKQGITNPPGNPAYNASKAAVNAVAEHLSFDLRDTKTSVHLLVPGWTFTGLTGAAAAAAGAGADSPPKPDGAWWPSQVADHLFAKMGEGKFYVLCPDNEVSADMDRRRIMWRAGDLAEERMPLSRWRPEYKEEVARALG